MSAIDVLRQIKLARRAAGAQKVVEWGNADYITEVGIDNMSRRELKNHLEARDMDTGGTRLELIERLRSSLNDEQMNKFAYNETLDTQFMIQADLEQRGSVYSIGTNSKGQLGIGDTEPRKQFVCIKELRGLGVSFLATGPEMCFAVTEEHDVYVWGGGGAGKTGISVKRTPMEEMIAEATAKKIASATKGSIAKEKQAKVVDPKIAAKANWMEPQIVKDLAGEEVVQIAVGSSHCLAIGKGGDCFVWGDGDAGQLGLGNFDPAVTIAINNSFPGVRLAVAGGNHSAVIVGSTQQAYIWGHAGNGRLGLGACERIGAPEKERFFFPIPTPIMTLEPVRLLSCGADHTLAYGASGVWSWGSGAGGKLGLGDEKDRSTPCLISKLKNRSVSMIVASTWHSMALAIHPPMINAGWVYTWGSGYHGQLAQETKQICLFPEAVEYFIKYHLFCKAIFTGSHHCAAITHEGELYTWGSNKHGCLGRKIEANGVEYTPTPGHCGGFGAIVDRIGRGFPRHVAIGREFTLVATYPYQGPDLDVATKLMEEAKIREQEELLQSQGAQQQNVGEILMG